MKVDICIDHAERRRIQLRREMRRLKRWGQITEPDCDRIQEDAMKNQAFIERLQTKLKEWDSQLNLLESRLKNNYIPTLEHVLSLDTLRAQADEVAAQWVELMSLGMREDLREDMDRTWEEMGEALTNATGQRTSAAMPSLRNAHQCFQSSS